MLVVYFNLICICEIDFIPESTKLWLENKRRKHNRFIQVYIVHKNESEINFESFRCILYLFLNIYTHDRQTYSVTLNRKTSAYNHKSP